MLSLPALLARDSASPCVMASGLAPWYPVPRSPLQNLKNFRAIKNLSAWGAGEGHLCQVIVQVTVFNLLILLLKTAKRLKRSERSLPRACSKQHRAGRGENAIHARGWSFQPFQPFYIYLIDNKRDNKRSLSRSQRSLWFFAGDFAKSELNNAGYSTPYLIGGVHAG